MFITEIDNYFDNVINNYNDYLIKNNIFNKYKKMKILLNIKMI